MSETALQNREDWFASFFDTSLTGDLTKEYAVTECRFSAGLQKFFTQRIEQKETHVKILRFEETSPRTLPVIQQTFHSIKQPIILYTAAFSKSAQDSACAFLSPFVLSNGSLRFLGNLNSLKTVSQS